MNNFLRRIKNEVLAFDGSKGTMLQNMGMTGGECPELWNIEHPDRVRELYLSYVEAGAHVIQTNTFGANRAVLEKFGLQDKVHEINSASVKLAKEAAGDIAFVAASIGPTGKLLEPSGELSFEEAYEIFTEQVVSVTEAGADIINFETMTDLYEMKAGLLAARENSPLPIIASMSFEENGRTLMGNSPAVCALVCQSLGADLIGSNCSTGPEGLLEITKQMYGFTNLHLSVKANAGMPQCSGDKVIYDETPEKFKNTVKDFVQYGTRLIGGCCGTTPEFIAAIRGELDKLGVPPSNEQPRPSLGTFICSATKHTNSEDINREKIYHLLSEFDEAEIEGLNETGLDTVTEKLMSLRSLDYQVICISLDILSKSEMVNNFIKTVQSYSRLPLIFHTSSHVLLESALRVYNGKAGVVIGGMDDSAFDLIISAKKYGSTIVDSSMAL